MSKDLFSRFGIETYTFRNFPQHSKVVELTKACGVKTIELCGCHFDPVTGDHAEVINEYASGGIELSAFFPFNKLGTSEESDRKVCEFVKAAGISTLVWTFTPDKVVHADKLATKYGINIAIHNHGRHDRWGPSWALEELFSQTSSHIGLCLDTAWALDSGENPVDFAKKFRARLYALHIKDFIFDRAGKPEDVVVGTGNLDLDGLNRYLIESGYDGSYTLEFEGDPDNPAPATKKCVEAVGESLGRIG